MSSSASLFLIYCVCWYVCAFEGAHDGQSVCRILCTWSNGWLWAAQHSYWGLNTSLMGEQQESLATVQSSLSALVILTGSSQVIFLVPGFPHVNPLLISSPVLSACDDTVAVLLCLLCFQTCLFPWPMYVCSLVLRQGLCSPGWSQTRIPLAHFPQC